MTHEPSAKLAYLEAERECVAASAAWYSIYNRAARKAEENKRWDAVQAAKANKSRLFCRLLEAQRLDIEEAKRAAQAVLDSNLDIEMGLAKLEGLA